MNQKVPDGEVAAVSSANEVCGQSIRNEEVVPKNANDESNEKVTLTSAEKKSKRLAISISGLSGQKKTREEIRKEVERQLLEQGGEDIPNEVKEKILDDIVGSVTNKKKKESFINKARLFATLTLFAVLASAVSTILSTGGPYVSKENMQKDMLCAINNGADIETLKVVYKSRLVPQRGILTLFSQDRYYTAASLTLLDVINDIKTNIYTGSATLSDKDKALIDSLNTLLKEYRKINPFDGLDESQRRDFMNIKNKIPEQSYDLVCDDVNSLVIDIKHKNELINRYLSSSNVSLYVSIAAFIFSIGLAIWQILPRSRATQRQIIRQALNDYDLSQKLSESKVNRHLANHQNAADDQNAG